VSWSQRARHLVLTRPRGVAAGLAGAVVLVVAVAAGGAALTRDDGSASATPVAATGSTSGPGGPTSGGAPPTRATAPSTAGGLPTGAKVTCPRATVRVATADELSAALAAAAPGTVIALADGTYRGHFVADRSGSADLPVWLCGGAGAVLDGGGTASGYVLHLSAVAYWRVVGITVTDGQKGIVADATASSVIQGVTVHDVGNEGIHLRAASTGNAVLDCTVRATGQRRGKFGEGIYVGSARSNWDKYGAGGGPDRSDHNLVQGNTISQTTAESVDIKEGTTSGSLLDNSFDGSGMSAADSWVDVKGNGWTIRGNTGRTSPLDGFQTHQILDGWGTGNTFTGNTADGVPGAAIHLAPALANVVGCGNAGPGVSSAARC
jgi:nitrous oxidase accessory protein NosD